MVVTIWGETGTLIELKANQTIAIDNNGIEYVTNCTYTIWLKTNPNRMIRFDNVKDEDIFIMDTPKKFEVIPDAFIPFIPITLNGVHGQMIAVYSYESQYYDVILQTTDDKVKCVYKVFPEEFFSAIKEGFAHISLEEYHELQKKYGPLKTI